MNILTYYVIISNMRNLCIYWKLLTKRAILLISYIVAILLCLSIVFSFAACGEEEGYDIEIGGDYRTVSVWRTGITKAYNVVSDHNGHKTFGVVTGHLWDRYVAAGSGYVTYKFSAAKGEELSSLKLDLEAYYSCNYKDRMIYSYDMPDEEDNWKTNIVIECGYDGEVFWPVYDFHEKHATDFSKDRNEYVGENALEINLLEHYSYKAGALYVRINIIHMTAQDFGSDANIYPDIFGKTADNVEGIQLARLGVRLYSAFIRGDYV